MYFPTGWPRQINMSIASETMVVSHMCCDAVKILVAAISDDMLCIWYANPLTPITSHKRSKSSVFSYGVNKTIVWKPDSRKIAILLVTGVVVVYRIDFESKEHGVLMQVDSPVERLKRESAELFVNEDIPCLRLHETNIYKLGAKITSLTCTTLNELLITTDQCELMQLLWTDLESSNSYIKNQPHSTETLINLKNIPFYANQNCALKTHATVGKNMYLSNVEYSPFIGGCAVVFNNHCAAFLNVAHLRFEMQNIHGFWAPDVNDATVCSINHKFRLLAFGRRNSDVIVFAIEDTTGGLEFSHRISLSSYVESGSLGAVNEVRWSPDGCVLAVTWENGGISLWSTFGALLMSSFNWDFGLHVDFFKNNPLKINRVEWSTEGYQLFLTCKVKESTACSNVLQINFVKSVLAVNPCMASQPNILLQGDDCLYLSQGYNLEKTYFGSKLCFPNHGTYSEKTHNEFQIESHNVEIKNSVHIVNILSENKHWSIYQLPVTYAASNWPIRYSAIDRNGCLLAVAGRTGLAHYSLLSRKWKVFGNETQEKDFVVSGGLLYWEDYLILGCYSLLDRTDEIRCYPEEKKLDNQFGNKVLVRAPVISLNIFQNQLIALTADGIISLFLLAKTESQTIQLTCAYEVDVKHICIHPACIVSLTVLKLKNGLCSKTSSNKLIPDESSDETMIVNVSGRILMIQRDPQNKVISLLMASCLASSVEFFWTSADFEKSSMPESLWFYCGTNGMRVWLPILPLTSENVQNTTKHLHAFMSKRIMLSFPLKLYPLVVLFDNVIALGVENETNLFCNELNSYFALPFCVLNQKSQVYLHKILRQLIKRNLGYSAWEIAKSCSSLPYFPHSLELLLHEVLEEEATSKEPIPDALLPSVLTFAREFPVYLKTVIQCARKTEIALWPYLFSVAGKPKDLFKQCLQSEELDTAASFLIILQNLEPSFISKQYAAVLLDIAIKNFNWELARDLIRFLKAIDPKEIDSPCSSMIVNVKIAPRAPKKPQLNANSEAFNMLLGPMTRERSFSTTLISHIPKERKDKASATTATISNTKSTTVSFDSVLPLSSSLEFPTRRKCTGLNLTVERKEAFCIDTIIQSHARTFLQNYKLIELGYMSAFLDFHLVSWLTQESDRAAKLDSFVLALRNIHKELNIADDNNFYTDLNTSNSQKTLKNDEISLKKSNRSKHTQSITSESGYSSLAKFNYPTINTTHKGNALNNAAFMEKPEQFRNFPLYISEKPCNIVFDFTCFDDYAKTPLVIGLEGYGNPLEVKKMLPEKLAIKLRYLLQLFIEANCIDYALVLSILLKDAASVGRIINGVIRSEPMTVCSRINDALKHLMDWTLEKECFHNAFIIYLRPYTNLLEKHLASAQRGLEESISIQMSEAIESTSDKQLNKNQSTSNLSSVNSSWNLEFMSLERQGSFSHCHSYEDDKSLASLAKNVKLKQQEGSGSCAVM